MRIVAKIARYAGRCACVLLCASTAICYQGANAQDFPLIDLPVADLPVADLPEPNYEPIQAELGLIEVENLGPGTTLPMTSIGPESLTVSDIVASVYRSFPEIDRARQEARLAQGLVTEAWGAYDLKLKAHTINEPTGFYENYRHGIGVARQSWWGGQLAAGYRIGRGEFQPWYRERETETGGEFKVGMIQPLLQGRAIDAQRVAVFRASLARQAASPILQEAILITARDATYAYWHWVAWGAMLEAQRELLDLAEARGEQFEVGVAAGKFAPIDLILNEQLIAERRGKTLETERKYRESAIKLSLYLRDDLGNSMVPSDDWLPESFPTIEPLPNSGPEETISLALQTRPEPRRLRIEIRQVELERCLARNQMLPRLDFIVEGSKDLGAPGSKSDDKGPFELVIGAASEVPFQRRKALGKLQSTGAKIAQIQQKLRLQRDKIAVEVRSAYNNLQLSAQVVEQSEVSLRAALESLDRYRFAFERGKIDLIYLNLLESKANEAEVKLIDSQQDWFMGLAALQAAAGFDPLEQAALVTELPASARPGPGRLPPPKVPTDEEFDVDWQRRIGPGDLP